MIRPVNFGFNYETAINNAFQLKGYDNSAQEKAIVEFDNFVRKLELYGMNVMVVEDTPTPHTPDSIFPNNWISFHSNDIICLFPMFAENRRAERKQTVIDAITKRYDTRKIVDLTHYENEGKFLEGTGSMVLDRKNKIVYACLSPRTNPEVLVDFCKQIGYTPVSFFAVDGNGEQIYHTNVMMCIADEYAVVCLDSIIESDRDKVKDAISKSGKEIISISIEQMNEFAGNMLQLTSTDGKCYLIMSSRAFRSLNREQVVAILHYNAIIDSELDIIEKNGGGSARCMLAEMFTGDLEF
jgi:hypothetical protein